jgi:hypothetical protein
VGYSICGRILIYEDALVAGHPFLKEILEYNPIGIDNLKVQYYFGSK